MAAKLRDQPPANNPIEQWYGDPAEVSFQTWHFMIPDMRARLDDGLWGKKVD